MICQVGETVLHNKSKFNFIMYIHTVWNSNCVSLSDYSRFWSWIERRRWFEKVDWFGWTLVAEFCDMISKLSDGCVIFRGVFTHNSVLLLQFSDISSKMVASEKQISLFLRL